MYGPYKLLMVLPRNLGSTHNLKLMGMLHVDYCFTPLTYLGNLIEAHHEPSNWQLG